MRPAIYKDEGYKLMGIILSEHISAPKISGD